jgi:hypothetical protein
MNIWAMKAGLICKWAFLILKFISDRVARTNMWKGKLDCTTSFVLKETRNFIPLLKSLNPFPSTINNPEALI